MTGRARAAALAALLLARGASAAPPAAAPEPHAAASTAPPAWAPGPPPPPLDGAPARSATRPAVEARLANGLRVVVVEHPRRPVVLVRLVLPRGAVTDPERDLGSTWLAVHLASDYHEVGERGDRLAGEKSLRRQVAELGGAASVEVDADWSMLAISGYARDAARYLAVLADAVVTPRHGSESFAARRNVLLDWIEDLESSDPAALDRVVSEAAFGKGHPYARPSIGTRQSLEPLGLEDVVVHQGRVLSPAGATLLVVGDVKAERIVAEARRAFGPWNRPAPPPAAVPPPALPGGAAEVGLLRRKPASTFVACATRPLPDVTASDAALEVLAAVLGGSSRSRLALALREEGALTYDARAVLVRRRAARALVACSAIDAARAEEGLRLFRDALDGLRARPPGEGELRRAKGLLAAAREDVEDDAHRIADAWLDALALGRPAPRPAQERAELERVGVEELRRLAAAVLRPATLRWIVSGDPAVAERAVQASRLGRLVPLRPGR